MNKPVSQATTNPYDPTYDPLVAPHPGQNQDYAPTYWADTAGPLPEDDGPVSQDMDVDVAIIGAGFTGLACAAVLAREYGIKATILDANQVSWGCTSRNGGQAQNASGRLKRSQWVKRWGEDIAKQLHGEIQEGFDFLQELIRLGNIECDQNPGGHLYVAHRPQRMQNLKAEVEVHNKVFGYPSKIISAETLKNEYVNDAEAYGAMLEPEGIGLHPLKLAYGYLRMAREAGATMHPGSPVTRFETRDGVHYLHTPGGIVKARTVAMATGGYTSQGLHKSLKSKIMPILSESMVTRPLTDDERAECNFLTNQIITDTRILRHYYRQLPDGRVQIGSRSAITGADAPNPKHLELLKSAFAKKFPALKDVDIDYKWWGWVDVAHDMMPRIFQPDPKESVFYALGYGGNGVMFSAQAGRRMAESIIGKPPNKDLPIFDSPLPGEFFSPFRRIGQRMLYHWYHLQDEVL